MNKADLVREDKAYYTAKTSPQLVEFDKHPYLIIEGQGEPAGEAFVSAVQALYPLAYGIKAACRKEGRDFAVAKLEGLWWVQSDKPALDISRKEWFWKLLIRMPDFVTSELYNQVKPEIAKKKGNSQINQVSFENIFEGKCVQMMHVGPYGTEPETISAIRQFMSGSNLTENGLHHEIYLSDPRKTPPEKMKTILRQPVK